MSREEIPTDCKPAEGVHAWPPDYTSGDTCNCGAFYLSSDGAAASIEQAPTAQRINDRAEEARRYLYIQGFLTDSENANVQRRMTRPSAIRTAIDDYKGMVKR